MQIRRVVTGQTADGTSVFVSDDVLGGNQFGQLWGSDDTVALPTDGTEPKWSGFFPPVNGFRFLMWTLPPEPPGGVAAVLTPDVIAQMNERLPGLLDAMEPDNPGMHTTDTIDFDIVLSGEVYLELDDGAEVKLTSGDCVIQNGTRHAWHNRSGEPATVASALVGAQRRE
jgi:mannose-6-phosphate isomerase-like protein (cupin superfamily)